ncbi:hypothetical protein ATCVMN08101_403R [Acanthocystis turfacea Chlorella virus MN0810.1]|nr:hypothetical protein ATCVMN08101_403R [Acanthocystis turfacea Chlorella virus MN0810.1]
MSANQKLSPLLVEAKNSYIYQIADIMAPFVVNTVNVLYAAAKKEAGFSKPTKKFQMKLREIPLWNQGMIDAQVTAIVNKYKFFPELVAAAFVSYVKILSSVKIHSKRPHIQLKLPADDVFVHKVFVNAAKSFYLDPALVKSPRDVRLALVRSAVETSVRELLPTEDILRAYLGGSVDADGVQTDQIDEEEIDLSPSPEEAIESDQEDSPVQQAPDIHIGESVSPVDPLGSMNVGPSPAPSGAPHIPDVQTNAAAIAQLQHVMNQSASFPVPSSSPQMQNVSPSPMAPPQQIITVPKTAPGAFVSPAPRQFMNPDSSGNDFFA